MSRVNEDFDDTIVRAILPFRVIATLLLSSTGGYHRFIMNAPSGSAMPTSKEQPLVAAYRSMATGEIERRLSEGDLTDIARNVALKELDSRKTIECANAAAPSHEGKPVRGILAVVSASVLAGVTAYWLLPTEQSTLLIAFLVPGIALAVGKAMPYFGLVVGWILLTTPAWLTAWLWHRGELRWHGYGTTLVYAALTVASVMALATGSALIKGARHKGPWKELEDRIAAQREDALEDTRKLR